LAINPHEISQLSYMQPIHWAEPTSWKRLPIELAH